MDKNTAIQFLAKLNIKEYKRLIEVFTNNDFPNISNETKEKVLIILKKLKASFS